MIAIVSPDKAIDALTKGSCIHIANIEAVMNPDLIANRKRWSKRKIVLLKKAEHEQALPRWWEKLEKALTE
jgi:hypothetical protein